ncbi:HXXEE domain-containing protein [Streptomyces sp. 15-116A]|uniref:HXXEE domain-containing protein n=1 Tax=Streptomyces sp. 15-116A TaxID=2259035 RepID=UPI0021B37C69|nr:HXXEE domain-containing protein [Streptomyces sp. 15-116A]MCT7355423.1 HXXEE domain-containing protein [Streptomyces sp. 15-116A]
MEADEQKVGAVVTFGLLAAWAVHDAEELVTVPGWLRRHVPELRARYPAVPSSVWRRAEAVDRGEFAAAVGVMGAVVAASAAGRLSGGRSAFYQAAVDGFGLHGLVHMAQAVAFRGYTPGSVTSPLVVVPYALWARTRLRRAGVLRPARARDLAVGLAVAWVATVGAHAVARVVFEHVQRGRTVSP